MELRYRRTRWTSDQSAHGRGRFLWDQPHPESLCPKRSDRQRTVEVRCGNEGPAARSGACLLVKRQRPAYFRRSDEFRLRLGRVDRQTDSYFWQGWPHRSSGKLGREARWQSIALTSPGIVYKDLIILGGRNPETLPAPPGDIRAYDVRSGQLRWSFHTIPHPGEFGYETWPKDAWKQSGAANNWAGMALDRERGIVFVPTGSAAFDFYGGDRIGDDLFANCLVGVERRNRAENLALPGGKA